MINFSKFKKIGDLDYFQGPFLSLFVDEQQGNLYLCSWLKKLDISHLWLVFQVNYRDILAYMQKSIDHLELSKRSTDKMYYLVEIGANAVVLNTQEISEELFLESPNLMVKAALFFDENCCENEAEIRAFLNMQKTHFIPKLNIRSLLYSKVKEQNSFKTKTKNTNIYAKQSKYV